MSEDDDNKPEDRPVSEVNLVSKEEFEQLAEAAKQQAEKEDRK